MEEQVSGVSVSVLSTKNIDTMIYVVRGEKVILDSDLALLYGLTTGNFNKAVNRNKDRFPDDFMFELTAQEFEQIKDYDKNMVVDVLHREHLQRVV
jgi:hypothetical protein